MKTRKEEVDEEGQEGKEGGGGQEGKIITITDIRSSNATRY